MDSSLHYAHSRQLQLTSTGDFNWRTKNAIVADRNGFHHRQQLIRPKDIAAECVSSFLRLIKTKYAFKKTERNVLLEIYASPSLERKYRLCFIKALCKKEVHLLSPLSTRSLISIFKSEFISWQFPFLENVYDFSVPSKKYISLWSCQTVSSLTPMLTCIRSRFWYLFASHINLTLCINTYLKAIKLARKPKPPTTSGTVRRRGDLETTTFILDLIVLDVAVHLLDSKSVRLQPDEQSHPGHAAVHRHPIHQEDVPTTQMDYGTL